MFIEKLVSRKLGITTIAGKQTFVVVNDAQVSVGRSLQGWWIAIGALPCVTKAVSLLTFVRLARKLRGAMQVKPLHRRIPDQVD